MSRVGAGGRASVRVVHTTRYAFDEVVAGGCALSARLEPAFAMFHQLVVRPLPARVERGRDEFGNASTAIFVAEAFGTLSVTALSVAPVVDVLPSIPEGGLGRLLEPSARVPSLGAFRDYPHGSLGQGTRAAVERLVEQVHGDFAFDPAAGAAADLARFVERRRGVCEDFAHFTIGCLRAYGLPAWYASGYIAEPGRQAGSHAWVAVRLPREGWLALDPTHGRVGDLGHVTLGFGRDYADVAPLRGTLEHRGICRMSTSVLITALDDPEAR